MIQTTCKLPQKSPLRDSGSYLHTTIPPLSVIFVTLQGDPYIAQFRGIPNCENVRVRKRNVFLILLTFALVLASPRFTRTFSCAYACALRLCLYLRRTCKPAVVFFHYSGNIQWSQFYIKGWTYSLLCCIQRISHFAHQVFCIQLETIPALFFKSRQLLHKFIQRLRLNCRITSRWILRTKERRHRFTKQWTEKLPGFAQEGESALICFCCVAL